MSQLFVIDGIDATHEGPVRLSDETRVHLQQGEADGACGPYVVFMALLALDLAKRDMVAGWTRPKGSTKLGKLLNRLGEGNRPLLRGGTYLTDLQGLLADTFGRDLTTELHDEEGASTVTFASRHLRQGRPVIVQISGAEVSHFVLAVGLGAAQDTDDRAAKLLVLDPANPAPTVCAWNGVIDARGGRGPYPYKWWTGTQGPKTKIQYTCALALWKK